MDINEVKQEIFDTAVDKGWHPEPDTRTVGDYFALITCEISEAYEEYRRHYPVDDIRYEEGKPEGIPIELADAVIRIFDFCHLKNIDIEYAMRVKMDFNKTRSFRHGGKKS